MVASDKPEDPWVTESGSRIKAWFIMRKDLEMTQGKFGVQIGHGADMIHIRADENPFHARWLDANGGNRRKIVLRAASVEELMKVKTACEESGMLVSLIIDAGLTEFGKPTITGMVVLPHDDADIPKVLKRAQVWKSDT